MIKRSIPKKLIPVENLTEDLTVGAGGIDVTSPPTKQNTVYNMENLNVDLDGGISLRKPLFFNSSSSSANDTVRVDYIFNDAKIELTTNKSDPSYYNLQNVNDIKTLELVENLEDSTDTILAKDIYYKEHFPIYINNTGIRVYSDRNNVVPLSAVNMGNLNSLNIINTNTSTIILGIKFNLNIPELKHYAKSYDLGTECYKYRPVKITKDEYGKYRAEVMQIETATLYTGENNVTRASFNIMDDYTYSFKDNYDAGYAYTKGIIKYIPNNIDKAIETYTIEELTESDKFKIVDSITKDEFDKKYILKAFVTNTAIDNPIYKLYCTWEKTYDNVTWIEVPEFLKNYAGNTIQVKIEDHSKSYETADKSYKYTRTVQYVKYINKTSSNKDTIADRPDVLVLDKMDSATYRFTIRSVATTPSEITKKVKEDTTYYTIVNGVSTYNNRNFVRLNSNNEASITVKFFINIEGTVEDIPSLANVHLTARTIYDQSGDYYYSYQNSFNDSLTDTVLDESVFQSINLDWGYVGNNTISAGQGSGVPVTIPIKLNDSWITQLMCIKFYLYESSDPTTEIPVMWDDVLELIVGQDMSNIAPVQNPTFEYYMHNLRTDTNFDISVISGESDYPDCYKYDNPYVNVGTPEWGPYWRTSSYHPYYIDRDNARTANYTVVVKEIQSKTKLPLELLNHLQHMSSASSGYTMYIFNKFKYYLKNVMLKTQLRVKTTVWASYSEGLGVHAYKAYADIVITLPIEIPLYNYLENPNSIVTLAVQSYDSIDVEPDHTDVPQVHAELDYRRGDSEMSDATYNKIKNFFERKSARTTDVNMNPLKYFHKMNIDSPLIYYFTITILEDVLYNGFNVSKYELVFDDAVLKHTIDLLNETHSVDLMSKQLFNYDTEWHYSYVENAISIDAHSLSELVPNSTPESYTSINYNMFVDIIRTPFKYLYKYDATLNKNTYVKLNDDDTLDVLGVYDAMKIPSDDDSSYAYNKLDQVLPIPNTSKYRKNLDNVITYLNIRYSLELAESHDSVLVTKTKQINTYSPINVYSNNTLYYNYRIWFYGKALKNNIYFSDTDSITVPIDNCITLSTDTDDYVTSLVPWRDYLIATTSKNIYLISRYNDSYTFKQINTFIGIPEADANTCKAILNGIVFKSGTAIYALHPNTYSSDETILNITDISKPISHHLIKGVSNFAISTEYEYYVFIPRDTDTLVFKYEYTRKVWSKFTYPIKICKVKLFNVGDIVVLDDLNNVYDFDKPLEWFEDKLKLDNLQYGDYLNKYTSAVKPIAFMLDTGQKSSAMQYTKQFTESKFIIATMEMKDTFPIETTIYVDGVNLIASHRYISNELQLITTDPNTDGAFSRTNPEDIGYLNTNIINDNGETFNVIRQMILRYMGKGKTIRHVLKGESTFNFKIYVLYYRYRIPHNKQ